MAGDIHLRAAIAGRTSPSPLLIRRSFRNAVTRPQSVARIAVMAKKNDQGGSGYRSAPAQGTPVICSGCGQPTTVPFEPRGDRPVFCRDCYQARNRAAAVASGGSQLIFSAKSPFNFGLAAE
jgi:CxxC-x17-CxxC domain-containing protein